MVKQSLTRGSSSAGGERAAASGTGRAGGTSLIIFIVFTNRNIF